MSVNMYSFVNLNKSPYRDEMEALQGKEFGSNDFYVNPSELDRNIDDVSMIEARLIRLIMRLIEYDKNYSGIVEFSNEIVEHFAVGTKFSAPMLYNAMKLLKENHMGDGTKPLITRYSKRGRVYWVNPLIMGKKSLIDKYIQFKAENGDKPEEPEVILEDDGEDAS